MKETIQAGSSKDQKKEENKEQRIIEIESMLGRTKCPLPEEVDTVSLFSRSRLYTPELATIAMNLTENMPYGKAAEFLNRTQHRSNNAVLNSVARNNCIIHWGTQIHQEQLTQAKQALLEFGFDPETGMANNRACYPRRRSGRGCVKLHSSS